jgi:hypothetical protein
MYYVQGKTGNGHSLIIIQRRPRLSLHASSEGRKIHVKSDEVRIWKESVVGILKGLAD